MLINQVFLSLKLRFKQSLASLKANNKAFKQDRTSLSKSPKEIRLSLTEKVGKALFLKNQSGVL